MSEALTRIVAVRHGETAWNVDARVQGHLDVGLNDTGRWQALRLAQALADERLDAVYSSDLGRAWQTAQALAEGAGVALQADVRLRERGFGVFEGLTFPEIEQRFAPQAQRWRSREVGFGPEGGETLAGFVERAVDAVASIAERHRGEHIAVVTHGGVLDALYRAASRIPIDAPRTWKIGNARINRLLHGEQGFMLVGWNDHQHLEANVP